MVMPFFLRGTGISTLKDIQVNLRHIKEHMSIAGYSDFTAYEFGQESVAKGL
jgi:hypothetical protein